MKKPNPQDFKIRCSAIHSIMATPKSPNLIPAGAQTYCKNWYISNLYQRKEYTASKYTIKGTWVENEAFFELVHAWGEFWEKNQTMYENDYLTGTPDIVPLNRDFVVDIKAPYSCFTFPIFDNLDPVYYWQMQGYMALTDRPKAKVVFMLMDAPEHVIEKEARSRASNNCEMVTDELIQEIAKEMTYSDLPYDMRIKSFEVERNEQAIKSIYKRVQECRAYLSELLQNV